LTARVDIHIELIAARHFVTIPLIIALEVPDLVVGSWKRAELPGAESNIRLVGDSTNLLVSIVPDVRSSILGMDNGAAACRWVKCKSVAVVLAAVAMALALLKVSRLREPLIGTPGSVVTVQLVSAPVDAAPLSLKGWAGGAGATGGASGMAVLIQHTFNRRLPFVMMVVVSMVMGELLVNVRVLESLNYSSRVRKTIA